MSNKKVQAIAGVNPNEDTTMMTVYPSISAGLLGRLIGSAMEILPVRILGLKISNLLVGPLAAPFGLLAYALSKVTGKRYRLTNKFVQVWSSIGETRQKEVALGDIETVDVDQKAGQAFYKAGDVVLKKGNGDVLMRLAGVVRPEIFRQTILKAREAHIQVAESLKTIEARQSA